VLRPSRDLLVAIARIVRRLRPAHQGGGLTPAGMSLLARLEERGPCGSAELAELERVTPPVVCTTLAGLLRLGLVRRDSDPDDGRRVVMSLTADGRSEVSAQWSAASQRVATTVAEQFTAKEREQLVAVVPLLQRLAVDL